MVEQEFTLTIVIQKSTQAYDEEDECSGTIYFFGEHQVNGNRCPASSWGFREGDAVTYNEDPVYKICTCPKCGQQGLFQPRDAFGELL